MTEPTPGATEPTTETPQTAASPAGLTDDHAQALLADAIATANALNGTEATQFDGEFDAERAATLITKLRAEKAALKGSATKAAEAAKAEMAQQIGKALGLIQDDQAPADPAKLTEQLTAASAQAKQAQLELAVYRAAGDTADPIALIDSRAFMQQVAAIDPGDTSAITDAITQAVAANPRLSRPVSAPQGMKRNPAQGASASPPLGINERIAAAEKAGDIRTAIRLKAGMALSTDTNQ